MVIFSSQMNRFRRKVRARVDGKLDRILNRKIARKSLGQPRVYATTCDESGIILAYFLLLFTIYVMIFVRFPVQMSQKSSCTWALNNGSICSKMLPKKFQHEHNCFRPKVPYWLPNLLFNAQFTHVRHSGSPYGISRYISVFIFPKSALIVHIEYSNLGNAVSVEEAVYGMKIHMYPFDLNKILYKILWEILCNVNFNFRLQFSWNCSFIEESFSKILKIWKVATGAAIFVVVQLPAPKWRHMQYGNSQAVLQN